jgi:predicted small integral membrane protein
VIRFATAAVVCAVAAFAAVVSYSHIYGLARDHGREGVMSMNWYAEIVRAYFTRWRPQWYEQMTRTSSSSRSARN